MEIKIENYLSHEEIKEVVTDELRNQIRSHFKSEENAKRLLSNLAYHIVMEEIDKIVPNYHSELVNKVKKLINEKDLNFHVYNFDTYRDGRAISVGAKIIEETVKEQKETIKQIVIDTIKNKDYSEEAWNKFESLAEDFNKTPQNVLNFINHLEIDYFIKSKERDILLEALIELVEWEKVNYVEPELLKKIKTAINKATK